MVSAARASDVAVLGAGSWGSALALHCHRAGHRVRLWARRDEQVQALRTGRNESYLPGIDLPPLHFTSDLAEALAEAPLAILAVPSAAVAEIIANIGDRLRFSGIICTAKGFHREQRMSEVMRDGLPTGSQPHQAVLLGPSHAEEVARQLPTAIVVAGGSSPFRRTVQEVLSTASLRVYRNSDLVGVESAAALKNILALAAGVCDGLGLGDNTKGALLTRGIAEIARLGVAMGARRDTFYGLSGIGDVITTCLSRHSRNRAVGEMVGRGQPLSEALTELGQVAEGVETTRTAVALARQHQVPMPIAEAVAQILFEGASARDVLVALMQRELKSETESMSPPIDHEPSLGRSSGPSIGEVDP